MATWTLDETQDLCNLEQARFINVQPIEEPEDPAISHAVIVIFPNEESTWLTSGSEEACKLHLSKVKHELLRRQQLLLP